LVTAWTLAAAGRYDAARPYLSQAEAEGMSGPLLSHARGLLLLGSGDARGAASALQSAVRESGDNPSARLRLDLATAFVEMGDTGQARRVLQDMNADALNAADLSLLDNLQARLR
jgi:FimV-like protein